MKPFTQQLLLVKCLYQRGRDALDGKGPFAAGFAVSHFQDAVELLLWATAVHVDAKPTEKFDALWDSIKQGPKCPAGKEPPLRSAMASLNKARVGFKHYGVTPDISEAARFEAYTVEFLTVVFRDFFGVEFATFSLVELVANATVLGHLKTAEQSLARGDNATALEEAAKAHAYLDLELDKILPRMGFDFEDLVSRGVVPGKPKSRATQRAEDLEDVVLAQRNFLAASSLKIRLADFLRFRQVAPAVFFVPEGVRAEWALDERRTTATRDDAEFAIRYATEFAIALERTLVGVKEGANLAAW